MISYNTCLSLSDLLHLLHILWFHPCCCKWHYFILFYGCIIFYCIFVPHLLYQSPVDGHLGYFHVLAIVNSAVMNIEVQVSFRIRVFIFSGYMPRSGIAGSYGSSIFYFYLFIYLWLCWVFVSVWGLSLVVASGGHSSSQCAGLSLSCPLLPRSTGSRCAGSVIVAHGPSRSTACGIFPDQGSNPCALHWQADSQPLRHQGSPGSSIFSEKGLWLHFFYPFYFLSWS